MVFLLLLGIIILLLFSKIRIEIQNFKFSTESKKYIHPNYQIKLKLKVLKKITIAQTLINNNKIEKRNIREKLEKIDLKSIQDKNRTDKIIIKAIKKAHIQYEKINLKIDIGTENACMTSFIVPAISTVISIWLSRKMKNYENQILIIQPIYQNKNLINIDFSGIFEIKMIHIINIIYILSKKGRVKEDERASHRRSYDYSYE